MPDDAVTIRLDSPEGQYQPGDNLAGTYRIAGASEPQSVEISVYWFTEGKGDEDVGVAFFEKRVADDANGPTPQAQGMFSTPLPDSPLSYDGVIVKVRWCVRVRSVALDGTQAVGSVEFRLGDVAAVREVS